MVDGTARWEAEAHTTLRAMLRIIQAITASTVEEGLELLEEQRRPLFQELSDNFGFVFGYSEVLQASLLSLMEPLIGQPESFGYEADEDLQRWWFYLREGGTQAIPMVAGSSDRDLANMLATINGLMAGCRKAGNRWAKLTEVMSDTQTFAQAISASLPEYRAESKHPGGKVTASESDIIRQRAIDWLAGPLWDGSAISSAVEFINPGGSRYYGFDEYWDKEFIPEVLTPLDEDHSPRFPKPRREHPGKPLGELTALAFATADLQGGSVYETFPCSLTRDAQTLARSIKAKLDALLKFYEHAESQLLIPNRIVRVPTPKTLTSLEPVNSQHKRLDVILGRDRKLVASAGEASYPLVEITLRGICSMLDENRQVNVLWIRSMRGDTRYTKITIALEMPLTGLITDQTTWWCFYDVAGTGSSDPEILRSEITLERLLHRYERNIKITDIGPLNDDQLIALLSPYGWNALRAAHKQNVDSNADLRAALSETLATLLIVSQGYDKVRNSVKLRNPKREIDAAGSRCREDGTQILVAEVKGRSTDDQDLKESYERFCDLVARLQQEPLEIAARLGSPTDQAIVRGIYISLGDAEKFEIPERNNVPLWGFNKFCEELGRAQIPARYKELLRKEHIAHLGPVFGEDDWMMIDQRDDYDDGAGFTADYPIN
ncbi:MAG: hypothetical protein F4X34_03275 [Chloroflexi bacterium]|nr:hypothetical protein [Chloroflexota bacterium]